MSRVRRKLVPVRTGPGPSIERKDTNVWLMHPRPPSTWTQT
jgi:hypothetical protein